MLRDHELRAADKMRKLVRRFGAEKINARADLLDEARKLKRLMLARAADNDPHHTINSAIRTYAPQLAGHKGKGRVLTSQSSHKLGYSVTKR